MKGICCYILYVRALTLNFFLERPGKTLQTISMLAYLASYKGIWGPHLIIVPTSCLVNWEVEFKRFCPGLKVLCYYGSAKRRKELRVGWTKANMHHVIITSYQLAVQDSFAFKRKKWYYLILDEVRVFMFTKVSLFSNMKSLNELLLLSTFIIRHTISKTLKAKGGKPLSTLIPNADCF